MGEEERDAVVDREEEEAKEAKAREKERKERAKIAKQENLRPGEL